MHPLVEKFTNNSEFYADNKTVEMIRSSTATVLRRLKNNLDVSVNEKSGHLIAGFIKITEWAINSVYERMVGC